MVNPWEIIPIYFYYAVDLVALFIAIGYKPSS
jgi:hypothetical protein